MLFRPEEIHRASGEGEVTEPFLKGDRGIGQDSFRFSVQYLSLFYFNTNR
jgi:hypothetical protein